MSRITLHGARAQGAVRTLRAFSALTAAGRCRLEPPRKNRNMKVQRLLQSFMKITEQDWHLPAAGGDSRHPSLHVGSAARKAQGLKARIHLRKNP